MLAWAIYVVQFGQIISHDSRSNTGKVWSCARRNSPELPNVRAVIFDGVGRGISRSGI
jgi:hypothetical protein